MEEDDVTQQMLGADNINVNGLKIIHQNLNRVSDIR
jgi:hypothetical protein